MQACPFALTHLLDDQAPGGKRAKQLGFGTDQVEQSKPIRTMQDDHLSIVYRRRLVARPQPDGKRGLSAGAAAQAAQRAIELEAPHRRAPAAAAIHGQRATGDALASLLSAMVNQQGSDVTEGEGRHDRDERLLVELACQRPSLHAGVPNYLP